MEQLCGRKMILCEGTFKTVPRMFYQLYTIRGVVHGFTFPLIYVLGSRKDKDFYQRMLDPKKISMPISQRLQQGFSRMYKSRVLLTPRLLLDFVRLSRSRVSSTRLLYSLEGSPRKSRNKKSLKQKYLNHNP